MGAKKMRNDDYRPACPKCSGVNFVAVESRRVANTNKPIPMIICADTTCQTVVGVVPYEVVWSRGTEENWRNMFG